MVPQGRPTYAFETITVPRSVANYATENLGRDLIFAGPAYGKNYQAWNQAPRAPRKAK